MKDFLLSPAGLACLWLLTVNLIGFCAMGIDKRKAQREQWRTPERRLFFWAVIGGSVGCILGMRTFRHKTKHKLFQWGMPAILILQLALAAAIWLWRAGLIGG